MWTNPGCRRLPCRGSLPRMTLLWTASCQHGVILDETPLFLDLEDSFDWSAFGGPGAQLDIPSAGHRGGRFRVIEGGASASADQDWRKA